MKGKILYLHIFCLLFICLLTSNVHAQDSIFGKKNILHSFYITANTGNSSKTEILEAITKQSIKDSSVSLLLVGNITPKKGFPTEAKERELVSDFLKKDLLYPLKDFNGKMYFTPGVNEWNSDAPESIDQLESFLQDNSISGFWPEDGCPIERKSISGKIEIISVDSQWFLEDWDNHPTLNVNCKYKTREEFFTEFKDDLKDSQGKLVIVAVHHPVMSNTKLPFFRKVTGASPAYFESNRQKELKGKLETLASLYEDVIFVSGNHNNLQFLYNDRNPQIISGAAAQTAVAKVKKDGLFASSKNGFAKLIVYDDLSSEVRFFEVTKGESKLAYTYSISRERPYFTEIETDFPEKINKTQVASIYTSNETSKNSIYKGLWGNRYRNVYRQSVEANVLYLDSLMKNPRPIAEGGAKQSRSLRLIDDNSNEFTLRAMRKDPIQYLQADVIQTNFVGDFLENTIAQRFVADFFTTAHPYAPFAVNDLSKQLNILHANPELYYLPKQKALGIYNEGYGNALYMFEEHVGEENKNFETFGQPDNIISTADLLLELRASKNSFVDQDAYLRARIFDMLIGDWDRHSDQWGWARYHENGKLRYFPIPRDRDHAFSKYDGLLFPLLKSIVPELRKMQSYGAQLNDPKWFNLSGYPLDQRFISNASWEKWKNQVSFIQQNLTDESIDHSFSKLPKEVLSNPEIFEIKKNLKSRRDNLLSITRNYFDYFRRFQTITGTKGNDTFLITRKPNGITTIQINTPHGEVFKEDYNASETSEIWIYGLEGEDIFEVTGTENDLIKLKIIGGVDEDSYDFKNPRKAKLYDFKSTKSHISNPSSRKWLVDSYDINHFHYKRRRYSENKLIPVLDYVTDAGITAGIKDVYTRYGLAQNPFTSQYILSAQYFFASSGYELNASAEFAHAFYNWNLKLEGRYSSPNYFINYFGSGNETTYDKKDTHKEFHRVKLEQYAFKPSLNWKSESGAAFSAGPVLEGIEVRYVPNSYLAESFAAENDLFDLQWYAGAESTYSFENKNNPSYPSLGTRVDLHAGYKQNIDDHNNRFGYINPSFSIDYPLIPSGFAVFATKLGGNIMIGDEFEFYHAATLGGNRSLRGYRNHRFNGKYSFYHSTDLRTAVGLIRTDFVPFIIGISTGFDYGRVWLDDDTSAKWHTNYGGSFWVNGFYALTANFGYYKGGDGGRFTFTLNFKY